MQCGCRAPTPPGNSAVHARPVQMGPKIPHHSWEGVPTCWHFLEAQCIPMRGADVSWSSLGPGLLRDCTRPGPESCTVRLCLCRGPDWGLYLKGWSPLIARGSRGWLGRPVAEASDAGARTPGVGVVAHQPSQAGAPALGNRADFASRAGAAALADLVSSGTCLPEACCL